MPIRSQSIASHFIKHWRYFQTSPNIFIPNSIYLILKYLIILLSVRNVVVCVQWRAVVVVGGQPAAVRAAQGRAGAAGAPLAQLHARPPQLAGLAD
jgi:hypothetical protein